MISHTQDIVDSSLESSELAQALIELESIQSEQDRRLRDNGVFYYTPNPIQSKAHNSKARQIIYCGANRSGKSTFGAVELIMHTVGWYPDWYPQYRRFNRAIKAVIVATEFPVVERVIEPKLRSYMPKDSVVKWKRSPQGYLQRMVVKSNWGGESVIDILTSEMDDMACESADWDFYWGDEPQQKSKFFAIQRGLIDRDGVTVLTFTPLIQPWMKTDLVDKSDGKNIEVFLCDIRDNKFDLNGKEILKEESIQAFEDMLPDEIKETRIHGKFFHLQGVVYKEFSDVHLRKFDYEQGLPVICVLDPHDRQPHHVIWAFLDKTDDLKVFYEMTKHCTLKELAANILGVEEHFGFKMRTRLIDPNFGRKPVLSSGKSVIEELSLCGVHFAEANDNIEAGQLKVKDYLHYNRNKPLDINNAPKIFFHKENCPLTIKSLRETQYEEWVGKTKGEKDPKESVKQKDTHGADCFDLETQVLTVDGWRYFKDIKVGDFLMTHTGEYQPCSDVISYHHKGDMVRIDSPHIDLLTTPNHNMLVDRSRNNRLDFCKAGDLKPTHRIPRTPEIFTSQYNGYISLSPVWTEDNRKWENERHIDSKLWAEFMGWYLSEGSFCGANGGKIQTPGRGYSVTISQSETYNKHKVEMIASLLDKLPWKWQFSKNNFRMSSKQLWNYVSKLGNSFTKRIPRDVLNLDKDCLNKMWGSLVLGDGWIKEADEIRQERESYATVSPNLAIDVQELLLKLGKPSTIQKRKASPYYINGRYGTNTLDQYTISPNLQRFAVLRNSEGKSKIIEESYDDMVYCATVPNHTLVVKRNNKTVVVGNCVRYLCMMSPTHSGAKAYQPVFNEPIY